MYLPAHLQSSSHQETVPGAVALPSAASGASTGTYDPGPTDESRAARSAAQLGLTALVVISSLPLTIGAPFRTVDTDLGSLALPLGLGTVLVIWLLPALLGALRSPGSFLDTMVTPVVALALGAYLWGLATAGRSPVPGRSAAFSLALLGAGSFAAWVGHTYGWTVTRRALVVGLGVIAVVGLVSGSTGVDWALRPNVWEPWQVARLAGATAGPNQIGQFGGLLAIVSAVGIRRRPRPGAVAVAGLLAGTACVLWSQTRTAGGALIVALVTLTVVRWRWRGLLWGLLATAIVVTTLVMVISPTRTQLTRPVLRYQSVDKLLTLTERTGLWSVARDDIAARPLTGWGAGAARRLYRDHWSAGEYETQAATVPTNSHNRLLDTAQTLGLVGASLEIASLVVLLSLLVRRRRVDLIPVVTYLLATSLTMPIPGLPTPVTLTWFAVLGAASTPTSVPTATPTDEATLPFDPAVAS